jgi:hypothetical protein
MTSQPPPPPGGPGQPGPDQQPPHGQQPYGQPQQLWGQQSAQPQQPWGQQPQPQQPWGHQPQPQQPWGQQPPQGGYGRPVHGPPQTPTGRPRASFDSGRVRMLDWILAAGALAYLIFALLPWLSDDGISVNGFSDSVETPFGDFSVGYSSGLIILAWLALVAAAVWSFLPALGTSPTITMPRSYVTVGLTGLAFLFTLIVWIQVLGVDDAPFSVMALLTFLLSAALLAVAVLGLLPELGNRRLPGGLTDAARWANQEGPQFAGPGQQQSQAGAPQPYAPPQAGAPQPYGQPGADTPQPPPPPPPPPPAPPQVPPTPPPGRSGA